MPNTLLNRLGDFSSDKKSLEKDKQYEEDIYKFRAALHEVAFAKKEVLQEKNGVYELYDINPDELIVNGGKSNNWMSNFPFSAECFASTKDAIYYLDYVKEE